jgi:hypothetical protein
LPGGDRGITGALYDSHHIVFITEDMRVVAKSTRCVIDDSGGGWLGINVRLPDLKYIEDILHVQFDLQPIRVFTGFYGEALNKKIIGNVVGMSVYNTVAGTTICVDVIAVGPP